jgi:HD-GYP domain-containing protein (c-di-GMP phosphodiesterase class II)
MRILAVADIFEAMTADRPYRPPLPTDEVLAELEADSGSKLDGDCVGALRRWLARTSDD